MDNWKMVKLGTTEAQRKLFFKLRQEQDKLDRAGLRGHPQAAGRAAQRHRAGRGGDGPAARARRAVPRRAAGGDDAKTTRADRLLPSSRRPAPTSGWATRSSRQLFREKLAEFAKTLEGKERYIFENRLDRGRAADAAGHRRQVRREPGAGAADRGGAHQPDARVHARAASRTSTWWRCPRAEGARGVGAARAPTSRGRRGGATPRTG